MEGLVSSYPKISLSDASELLQLCSTELISSEIINEKTQGGFSDDDTHLRFQDTLERIAEYIENDLFTTICLVIELVQPLSDDIVSVTLYVPESCEEYR